MYHLSTVQIQSEFKSKVLNQNLVYGEDLEYLTPKTKSWQNNPVSRGFGKYSFQLRILLQKAYQLIVNLKVQTFQGHAILFLATSLLVPGIEILANSILS